MIEAFVTVSRPQCRQGLRSRCGSAAERHYTLVFPPLIFSFCRGAAWLPQLHVTRPRWPAAMRIPGRTENSRRMARTRGWFRVEKTGSRTAWVLPCHQGHHGGKGGWRWAHRRVAHYVGWLGKTGRGRETNPRATGRFKVASALPPWFDKGPVPFGRSSSSSSDGRSPAVLRPPRQPRMQWPRCMRHMAACARL